MDSDNKEILYLDRAKNELDLAKSIFKISIETKLKLDLELKENSTFFSNVISNAYYCIFYSAKAFLFKEGIITSVPDEHNKTLREFEKLAISGKIDKKLLKIYEDVFIKAEELLGIFIKEKSKRGKFTYKTLPQTNLEPAKESLENAEKFYKNINLLIKKK
ncbi:MAG: hypothetical protein AABY06_03290 [Nanoarchaeota archaeon]|mgnify:FL=1